MKNIISKKLFNTASLCMLLFLLAVSLSSCKRYEPVALDEGFDILNISQSEEIEETAESVLIEESEEETIVETEAEEPDLRERVKVKGIYLASKPLSNAEFMDELWDALDDTELNAVVIDIKDDYGKVTYNMQGVSSVDELDSVEISIKDLPSAMKKFKEHGIYTIARIVTMRDPHMARVKPEWCLTKEDGTIFKDSSGYPWVNPYKTEYWDYILDIGKECARIGFNEVQFDYIRFCTEKGADECVYDEEEVKGRDKISIITELVQYLYENLKKEGVFVSCDVFGTIIQSRLDSRAVGQSYSLMAAALDYICPMVYPSHYANKNFGLDVPDKHPYEAIKGALKRSVNELKKAKEESESRQAIVRPWLQSFTATWLGAGNYIKYDGEAVRKEIQGVYDAGYDEWILWSASVSYDYDALLSPEEAEKEEEYIAESRAALPPEEDPENMEETFPPELEEALDGENLYTEDELILLEDGPIITYE